MAWMRAQAMEWEEDDSISGYYQLRGSGYLCDICDDEVGFHPNIEEIYTKPYPHAHCLCYRIPIHSNDELNNAKKRRIPQSSNNYTEVETQNGRVRIHDKHGKSERTENLEIATYLAEKYGYEIDLIPKSDNKKSADSFNWTLGTKQEYKVNSTPTYNAIDRLIRDAKNQAKSIVIRIDSNISLETLRDAIIDRVRRSQGITDITIIKNNLDVRYSRDQIISDTFKIQSGDFK